MAKLNRRSLKQTLAYNVARGVRFMNKEYGKHWLRKIDPERLALESGESCILGQTEGDFYDALVKLGIDEDFACTRGFMLSGEIDHKGSTRLRGWHILNSLWKHEVKALQEKHGIEA